MANIWDERQKVWRSWQCFALQECWINWQLNCENYLHAIRGEKTATRGVTSWARGQILAGHSQNLSPTVCQLIHECIVSPSFSPEQQWFLALFQAARIHGGNRIHVGISFKLCNRDRSWIRIRIRIRIGISITAGNRRWRSMRPWIWHGWGNHLELTADQWRTGVLTKTHRLSRWASVFITWALICRSSGETRCSAANRQAGNVNSCKRYGMQVCDNEGRAPKCPLFFWRQVTLISN